jgi:hypothetical protein
VKVNVGVVPRLARTGAKNLVGFTHLKHVIATNQYYPMLALSRAKQDKKQKHEQACFLGLII